MFPQSDEDNEMLSTLLGCDITFAFDRRMYEVRIDADTSKISIKLFGDEDPKTCITKKKLNLRAKGTGIFDDTWSIFSEEEIFGKLTPNILMKMIILSGKVEIPSHCQCDITTEYAFQLRARGLWLDPDTLKIHPLLKFIQKGTAILVPLERKSNAKITKYRRGFIIIEVRRYDETAYYKDELRFMAVDLISGLEYETIRHDDEIDELTDVARKEISVDLIKDLIKKIRYERENTKLKKFLQMNICELIELINSRFKDYMISVQDSYKVKNCIVGTEEFLHKYGITEESMKLGDFVEKYPKEILDNPYFRKVLSAIII